MTGLSPHVRSSEMDAEDTRPDVYRHSCNLVSRFGFRPKSYAFLENSVQPSFARKQGLHDRMRKYTLRVNRLPPPYTSARVAEETGKKKYSQTFLVPSTALSSE